MDRCWFVLKQKHYPPPQDHTGPIQLGNFIPDLKHLDQVINNDPGPHPFPARMVVYPSVLEDLTWDFSHSNGADGSIGAQAPVPQTASLASIGGKAGLAFQKSVSDFWNFKTLDTQIIQPTEAYIDDSLKTDIMQRYLNRRKNVFGTWSMFMITGLAIARAATGTQKEEKSWGVHGGPEVSLAGLAGVDFSALVSQSDSPKTSFRRSSDFVWAIQVMKISKSMFSSQWAFNGATYAEEDQLTTKEMLADEGIDSGAVIYESEDDVFVLPGRNSFDLFHQYL